MIRELKVEIRKTRRRFLWALPLGVVLIEFLILVTNKYAYKPEVLEDGYFYLLFGIPLYNTIFLPLTLAVMASRICDAENKGNTYKLLCTMQEKRHIFDVKLLLGGLYVVPISESLPLRTATFLKMLLLDGVPFARAKQIFRKARLSEGEARVMSLARQALLSTAELIRCVDLGVTDVSSDDKLMDALYSDADATSDNMGDLMRTSKNRRPVTRSVARLCLHKQIIFERV